MRPFSKKLFGRLGGYKGDFFNNPFSAATPESVTTPAMNPDTGSNLPPDSSSYLDQAVNKAKGFYNEKLAPGRNMPTPEKNSGRSTKPYKALQRKRHDTYT